MSNAKCMIVHWMPISQFGGCHCALNSANENAAQSERKFIYSEIVLIISYQLLLQVKTQKYAKREIKCIFEKKIIFM